VEARGEEVGPGVVGSRGGVPAVGDAVAERYYGGGLGSFNFYAFDEVPDRAWGGVGEGGCRDLIVAGNVVGLE